MTFYHVTPAEHLEAILVDGLRPMPSRYEGRIASREGCVYLATTLRCASEFYREQHGHGLKPVCLRVELPAGATMLADEDHFEARAECTVDSDTGLPSKYFGEGPGAWYHFGLDHPPATSGWSETLAQWAARQPLGRKDILAYLVLR